MFLPKDRNIYLLVIDFSGAETEYIPFFCSPIVFRSLSVKEIASLLNVYYLSTTDHAEVVKILDACADMKTKDSLLPDITNILSRRS